MHRYLDTVGAVWVRARGLTLLCASIALGVQWLARDPAPALILTLGLAFAPVLLAAGLLQASEGGGRPWRLAGLTGLVCCGLAALSGLDGLAPGSRLYAGLDALALVLPLGYCLVGGIVERAARG